jgi:hypothetical protein
MHIGAGEMKTLILLIFVLCAGCDMVTGPYVPQVNCEDNLQMYEPLCECEPITPCPPKKRCLFVEGLYVVRP